MPFGLTCALSVFQRLMDCVLCGLSYMTCLLYLDDVIDFGSNFEEELVSVLTIAIGQIETEAFQALLSLSA